MASDDDVESVKSVSTNEQISFWSLTVSFMLKLITLGIMIFVLPYNEWIVLENAQSSEYVFMRGISGSDCVRKTSTASVGADDGDDTTKNSAGLECVRWHETLAGTHDEFWTLRIVLPSNVQYPSAAYCSLYYIALFQIIICVLDMGATLALCCRYRAENSRKTMEKRFTVICCLLIMISYLCTIIIVNANRNDFLNAHPPFEACLGNAFRLFLGAILLYLVATVFIYYSEFYRVAFATVSSSDELPLAERVFLPFRGLFPVSSTKYTPANTI